MEKHWVCSYCPIKHLIDLHISNLFDLKTLIGDENVSLDSIIVDWVSLIKVLIKK